MSVAFAPTGQQTMSQREVDAFLQEARSAPTTKSPRVLGINQIPLMRARNNGYPVHMYHPTLDMRVALKEEEEMQLANLGYGRNYIMKAYPKALYRRNMDARFEPQYDLATGVQTNNSFVEEKTARDEKHEKELRLMKPKQGQSDWFEKITDLPEIAEASPDDPSVKIARLEGRLSGIQAASGNGPRGRRV